MDSTHGASNPFAGVPESASLSQTTYFEADAPPEAESEESAYVSFTVWHPPEPALPRSSRPVCRLGRCARAWPPHVLRLCPHAPPPALPGVRASCCSDRRQAAARGPGHTPTRVGVRREQSGVPGPGHLDAGARRRRAARLALRVQGRARAGQPGERGIRVSNTGEPQP